MEFIGCVLCLTWLGMCQCTGGEGGKASGITIFTRLTLCLVTMSYNFKWVKITYIIMYNLNQNMS